MPVVRLIVVGLVIWLAWMLFKRLRGPAASKSKTSPPPQSNNDNMVRCAQCRVYVPQHQAIRKHGEYFCCEEHSKRG